MHTKMMGLSINNRTPQDPSSPLRGEGEPGLPSPSMGFWASPSFDPWMGWGLGLRAWSPVLPLAGLGLVGLTFCSSGPVLLGLNHLCLETSLTPTIKKSHGCRLMDVISWMRYLIPMFLVFLMSPQLSYPAPPHLASDVISRKTKREC